VSVRFLRRIPHRPIPLVSRLSALAALAAAASAAEPASAVRLPAPAAATESRPATAAPRLAGTPFLRVWRPDDYGAHPENNCILQHPGTGLIYVGNADGVLEFDGVRWRLLRTPERRGVHTLGLDRRGRIWGATSAEIFRLDPGPRGQWEVRSMLGRLPPEFRRQRIISRCITTADGMYFFDEKSLLGFGHDDGPARIWTVAEGLVVAIRIWEIGGEPHVMIGGNVVHRLRAGVLERMEGFVGSVWASEREPDGSWTLLTPAGTDRWDGRTQRSLGRLPAGEGAQHAAFLADGRTVFATLRSGLIVGDRAGRVLQAVGRAQGLPANQVNDVMEDREGGVWAAFHNGVARVQFDSPYARHGSAQGVEGTINSLARHGDRLFAGGTEGAFERLADGRFQPMPEAATAVREVAAHGDWLFILSTRLRGLRPGRDAQAGQLENRNYFGLLPMAGQPGWYVHGANEGVRWARFESEKWITQGPLAALSGRAGVLLESPPGVVWAAQGDGAWRIDFQEGLRAGAPARRFGAAEGLPGPPVAMFRLGEEIVALAAGRLVRFHAAAERFAPETRLAGLDELVGAALGGWAIVGVHAGSDGTIWLQAAPPSGRIARIRPEGANRWRVETLPGEPLTHLRPTSHFHETATQTLWIGGHGALVSCDLTWQPRRNPAPPAVVMRQIETPTGEVLYGGGRAPGGAPGLEGPLHLGPQQNALRLQFAAPVYAADHAGTVHLEYRTRLDGLDHDWSNWSRSAEREFTHLPWQAFTFRVQARDGAGRIGPEAVWALAIAPAWWATGWAWAGYGMIGVAGVAGIVRLRTRVLQRRAERLGRIVAERTRELAHSNALLAAQNTELARLHRLELDEKIAAQLSEEKARLELLRYQLNPHFLLNAFTSLRSLVFSSPEAAGKTVERLADFCRLALTRSDETGASVDDEVRLIESYLDTEKARWRDELQVELRIDPAARPLPLPPFLLQPLVENAIKYGGRTSPGTLQVRLGISRTDEGLTIEVANTGEWVESRSPHRQGSTGIGLENLRQRLRRQYRDAHDFSTEARGGWVYVRLRLGKVAIGPSGSSNQG